MKSSIATVCIGGSLREKIVAISKAGFDGYELFENDLISSSMSPEELAKRTADLGLSLDLYQPFRDFEGVSDSVLAANLERARHKFELMGRLGADTVLLCSNVASTTTSQNAVAVEQLAKLANLATEHGVKVAYEALAWGTNISTWDAAWNLVKQVDSDALGICLDSFHILSRGSDLEGIADIPGNKIFFCQLADAPRMSLDVLSWSRHYRLFPGEGDWDLADFVARVVSAGYSGPLSLEVFNDVYRQGDPALTASDAKRSLLVLEEAVASRFGVEVEATSIPPLEEPSDFSFVELRPGEGGLVSDSLSELGFVLQGRHRRKNSQLWSQGTARIIVNDDLPGRSAGVAAIGLEVADVKAASGRARALRSRTVPRDHEEGEEVLEAVSAPDGTDFYFSARQEDGSAWESEFGGAHPAEVTIGITGIDHIALVQPWQRADEATLFFRSIIGLSIDEGIDLPSASGLVRSRSLVSAERRIRLALNVPPVVGSDLDFPNHIALASTDLLATVRELKDRGVSLLSIPQNYYDDLEAKFALGAKRVDELSQHSILFDRRGDGQFLHVYLAPVGDVFFEIVERVNGYDGYGADNAHVRLAALRSGRVGR